MTRASSSRATEAAWPSGKIDGRQLAAGTEEATEEVRLKVEAAKPGGEYLFHSDHSAPSDVPLANYRAALAALTPRQHFIHALVRRPPLPGTRVLHFELVFFVYGSLGKVHTSHRSYHQWDQMEEGERQLHQHDMAELFVATARRFEHDAIFLHPNPGREEEVLRLIDPVRQLSGQEYFLMLHGDVMSNRDDG